VLCTKCDLHLDAETVKVSSRGSENPVLLFVAEAPGKKEDKIGVCLIGPSGKKLDSIVEVSKIDPKICRFTNVVRCIPYNDTYKGVRPPTEDEINACKDYLEAEILAKNPVYIVPLGATAIRFFLPKIKAVKSVRGKRFVVEFPSLDYRYKKLRRWLVAKSLADLPDFVYSCDVKERKKQLDTAKDLGFNLEVRKFTVIPTYHPAAILRRSSNDPLDIENCMIEDFRLINKYINGNDSLKEPNYKLLRSLEEVEQNYNKIKQLYKSGKIDRIAIDIETISVGNTKKDKRYIGSMAFTCQFFDLVLFSISYDENKAITIPWNHPESPFREDKLLLDSLVNLTNDLLEDVPVIGHNLTFDIKGLRKNGIVIKKVAGDTYLSSWTLFNDTIEHGLEYLATKFTEMVAHKSELNDALSEVPSYVPLEHKYFDETYQVPKFCIEDDQGVVYRPRSMMDIPIEIVHKYCCSDTDATLRLDHIFNDMMKDRDLFESHNDLTVKSILPFSDVEYCGVKVDLDVLSKAFEEYSSMLQGYYDFFNELDYLEESKNIIQFNTGKKVKEVKLSSFRIKAVILYDILDLPVVKETKTGPSTDKESLGMLLSECNELLAVDKSSASYYQHRIDVINKIKEFNKAFKLFTSYIRPLPTYVDKGSYIHTNIGNRTTDTGRCNCFNPSLHTIPWKSVIKKAFVPDEDSGLIAVSDYSQMELRILGLVASDEKLLKAFLEGKDLHRYVSSIVLKKLESDVTEAERRRIKAVNFGIVFGRGAKAIAVQEGISKDDAQGIIDRVFEEFPGVGEYVRKQHEIVHRHMKVETISGFQRIFPEGKYTDDELERRAQNTPIQGPASDVTLYAMNFLYRLLKKLKLKSRIWCTVHDSICKSIYPGELLTVLKATRKCMVDLIPRYLKWLDVPLECDFEVGVSWGNLIKCKLTRNNGVIIDGLFDDCTKVLDRVKCWENSPTIEGYRKYVKEEKKDGKVVKTDECLEAKLFF
jgi:uracil-DNA glycosylase family 4